MVKRMKRCQVKLPSYLFFREKGVMVIDKAVRPRRHNDSVASSKGCIRRSKKIYKDIEIQGRSSSKIHEDIEMQEFIED